MLEVTFNMECGGRNIKSLAVNGGMDQFLKCPLLSGILIAFWFTINMQRDIVYSHEAQESLWQGGVEEAE